MTMRIEPAPIRKELEVAAPIERAFSAFFEMMHLWSPKAHTLSGGERRALFVEPKAGGRWYEIDRNGRECDWGQVVEWDPPHRALLLWQISSAFQYEASVRTEVEVQFFALAERRTRIVFEHRHIERLGGDVGTARGILDGDRGWGGWFANYATFIEEREG
jgi:uncharacterized protein YndB with AHSA1/START domain